MVLPQENKNGLGQTKQTNMSSNGNAVNVQKSLPILSLVIILVLVIAGGLGYYFFTRQNNISVISDKSEEISPSKIPENFVTHESPVGFSISYPNNWTLKDNKGVDTILGGALILSPGSKIAGNYAGGKDDVIEQYIFINIGATLQAISLKDKIEYYKNNFEKENLLYIKRKIIDQKPIIIDGKDAYEVVYTENNTRENTMFNKIAFSLLPDPAGVRNYNLDNIGLAIYIEYTAKPDVYSQALAEQIISTFKENILKTYEMQLKQKTQNKPQTSEVQIALSNLRVEAEVIYDPKTKSYPQFCSDGVLNASLNPNIQSIVTKVISALGVSSQKEALVQCYSSGEKYAVSAKTSEDQFWCVDNTGASKARQADKVSLTCK